MDTSVTKYAIEDSFPIVEINRLAIPERNAFKPIYQMHKWFARRASCVFRAILLGCMKPLPLDDDGKPIKSGAEIIMEEFYKDHTNDPDTKGKVILDPFMGGGTTVVEALRLGCKVIGIDLNPVAWFIVKTEVEPVDIDELKASFRRLSERKVTWGEKSVKETLLEQYKTECPCCGAGREEADIIYTFWVKSAICTNPLCKKEIPLFSDYIIANKSPSIRYSPDVECPECGKSFDWEIEPASLIAEPGLCVVSSTYSAGIGRTTARWAFSTDNEVECPWCHKQVKAKAKIPKPKRKKVPLTVLLCPHCYNVWQWRGDLPEEVNCPVCKKRYSPKTGNIPKSGWFLCPSCGHTDRIINSIRSLPEDKLLTMRPYAIEGYCKICAGDVYEDIDSQQINLDGTYSKLKTKNPKLADHPCLITKNNGKFFKRVTPADLARYQRACEIWEKEKKNLLYPKQRIPEGFNTNQMIKHHYHYWYQMFNPRQLLCISTLLKSMDEEPDQILKEILLSAFFQTLRNQCMFCFYNIDADKLEPLFSRKDYAPPNFPLENSVWGTKFGRGTFTSVIDKIIKGKEFCWEPFDRKVVEVRKDGVVLKNIYSAEVIKGDEDNVLLEAKNSANLDRIVRDEFHFVITDPPYAQNVNYSEVADFFYVWLRLILAAKYSYFAPEITPKAEEIIQHDLRGKTLGDFQEGLKQVFALSASHLNNGGLLAFTFHHEANATWDAVLDAIMEAGYCIEAVYPYESDARKGGSMGAQKIAYDLIHVCRKRAQANYSKLKDQNSTQKRSWAGIRQEIRRRAREEIKAIEAGRYGEEPLSPADINIILIGKCLELYSRYYGAVIDHEGNEVKLEDALEEIRMMVDQLVTTEEPLPSELADIDPESYVYFTCLCDRKEVKSDDVHKATRGILEPDTLIEAGIMIRGRAGRGRSYEVKQPLERFHSLLEKFNPTKAKQQSLFGELGFPRRIGKIYFIDYVHFLMALVEGGENAVPWLERFRGETPKLRAAVEYIARRNNTLAPLCHKLLSLIDLGPLFSV